MAKPRTQRRKFNGGRFGPGNVYYFNKKNVDTLDRFIEQLQQQRKGPVIMRHSDKECIYCKRFEKPWSAIEASASETRAPYSVASLDPWATSHIMKRYPKYPRVNGVPAVVLVDKNGVPIEHTGANTLEDLEKFLSKNGLKLQIVPMDDDNESSYEDSAAASSSAVYDTGAPALGSSALGSSALGSSALGSSALGTGAETSATPSATTDDESSPISAVTRPISDAIGAATGSISAATGSIRDAFSDAISPNSDETTNPNDATASPSSFKQKVAGIDNSMKETLTKSIDFGFNNLFGVNSDTPDATNATKTDATKTDATKTDANGNKVVPQLPSSGGTKRTKRTKRSKRSKRTKRTKRSNRSNRKHRK